MRHLRLALLSVLVVSSTVSISSPPLRLGGVPIQQCVVAAVGTRAKPQQGERAVASLAREVEACLLRHDRRVRPRELRATDGHVTVDTAVLAGLLRELRLDDFQPLLEALPSGLVAHASGPGSSTHDLRAFVREVSTHAIANPLLCRLAYELSNAPEPLDPVADAEMFELVHYCLLLDVVTRVLANDPELAARVYARLVATVHETPGWWRPLGVFELAKLKTVEMTLERFIEHRRDANLPTNFGHIGLPFNILEAVLQDVKLGYLTNAAAGLALCMARPGQGSADNPGLGASLSTDNRRAVRMHLPLEQQWKDLYVSWNMAFTTAYADAPTRFGAPLLAPVVLGAPPDEFMFHRVLALHTHICLFVLRRTRACAAAAAQETAPPELALPADDRRRRSLSHLWGSINLEAARRYERRLRLAPLVAMASRLQGSAMAARRLPYPASLILPPPSTAQPLQQPQQSQQQRPQQPPPPQQQGVVRPVPRISARERAERVAWRRRGAAAAARPPPIER